MENEKTINQIDFADSEILSYTITPGQLILLIERWNAEILEIKFLQYESLFAMNYFRIAKVEEVFESPLLERVLNEFYEKKPKDHSFRVLKFLTSDDFTALEVVFEDVYVKVIQSRVDN